MPRKKLTYEQKKALKKQKDYESTVRQYKHTIESSLEEIQRMDVIPDPAYTFEVGDRCIYGAFDWSGVLEVCDGGKYYKLFSINFVKKSNMGEYTSFKIHYEVWFRLSIYRDSWDDTPIFQEDDDIFFGYSQRDMRSLLSLVFKQYGIDLEPEYQRGLVWSEAQKWLLIDSIFKNIDIGKFTIIKRPWGDDHNKPATPKLWEMLDGKQRITALWEFYTGQFKYKGKYFHELHPLDRYHFKQYRVNYAECDPLTDEQKYRYFLKLNTTGVPIEKEHIERVKELWKKAKEMGNGVSQKN